MASNPVLTAYPSRDAMSAALAEQLEAQLRSAVGKKGHALIALSGGSTPKRLYEILALRDLPWDQIAILLVDERWVPGSHARSNEGFVRKAFAAAKGATILGLYNDAPEPHEAIADIENSLRVSVSKFDVVVLGMGEDGHTASWFPHAEGLDHALKSDTLVSAITAQKSSITGDEIDRITLTLCAIRAASHIVLLITGAPKRQVYTEALEEGPVEDMPVRAILRARPDLKVAWAP